jgi:5-methylcytosine-specific restriction endonuclease McrA
MAQKKQNNLFSFFEFKPSYEIIHCSNLINKSGNIIPKPSITQNTPPTQLTQQLPLTQLTQQSQKQLSKYKKKSIPKSIKINIWNTYIGEDIMKHKCFCCKKNTIKIVDFEAGHVLSEANGGTDEITNFRPICRSCNSSMGTMHMEEYVKKYGLYI